MTSLYFYMTRGCNLRCRHCWVSPQRPDWVESRVHLELDLLRSIVAQAIPLGLHHVKLTGGEPLIHPQIREILHYISKIGLQLSIETNGVICTPDLVERIAASRDPFVSVSIDGTDATTHEWLRGVAGCFQATLQGVRNLVQAGIRPQIIMTVMRRNAHQMGEMVRMSEALGAGSVKFNLVQPISRGAALHEAAETLGISDLVQIGQWVETELAPSSDVQVFYSHPIAFRPLSRMFGREGDGLSVCNITGMLGVLSDGTYALCGIAETVPQMVFGNARIDTLADVWLTNPILTQIRDGLPNLLTGVCSQCTMKALCRGCCVAQNFASNGDLWAPYWYCEHACREGLFPSTRLLGTKCPESSIADRATGSSP